MTKVEQRKDCEMEINKIIENAIKKYQENFKTYKNIINKSKTENLEPIYIILEKDDIIQNVLTQFPYYYEFLSIPIVSENQLKDVLQRNENSKNKYPVLWAYLNSSKKDIEYLQTFSQINNFVNYTIDHYTNQISREKAKKIKIKEELNDKKIPMNLFKEFLKGFNESGLYKIADRYECHSLKDILNGKLSEKNNLADFLIDNGVQGYGMKIAAIYQKYISFQNTFLSQIINNIPNEKTNLSYVKKKYLKE